MHTTRKIITIGETVLDIIFKNDQPIASTAGGSMLNTSVTLGRLGLPVHFISEYGNDPVGLRIDRFLTYNGISTDYVYRYDEGKSALALAFLDDSNNANYTFYKAYPQKRFDIAFPEVNADDIVLFGSIYAITPELRTTLRRFLLYAKSKNALLYYDPNFRKAHLDDLEQLRPAILENMSLASVVRASNEDLEIIFGAKNSNEAYEAVSPLCNTLIYTSSSDAVYLKTPYKSLTLPNRQIEPVSTIGAGDTFNAGIAYGLYKHRIGNEALQPMTDDIWQQLIGYGIDFATEVCLSYENYITTSFAVEWNRQFPVTNQ
ncbi:MAG: fructokinase [Bacteroidetes bacterium]|nr:fructokinase [Bacteroidota bacterium]